MHRLRAIVVTTPHHRNYQEQFTYTHTLRQHWQRIDAEHSMQEAGKGCRNTFVVIHSREYRTIKARTKGTLSEYSERHRSVPRRLFSPSVRAAPSAIRRNPGKPPMYYTQRRRSLRRMSTFHPNAPVFGASAARFLAAIRISWPLSRLRSEQLCRVDHASRRRDASRTLLGSCGIRRLHRRKRTGFFFFVRTV